MHCGMRFTMLIPLALMHIMKLTKRRQRAKTSGSGCRWCVGLAALSLHQMMMINQVVTEMLIGRAPPKDRHFLQAWKTNNIYNIIYDEQSKYIYIILNNGEKNTHPQSEANSSHLQNRQAASALHHPTRPESWHLRSSAPRLSARSGHP